MKTETPQPIHLTDYRPVPYLIDNVDLDFRLDPNATEVRSRLSLRPNPASAEKNAPLVLDGERITLQSLVLDGAALQVGQYEVGQSTLTIASVPQQPFTLEGRLLMIDHGMGLTSAFLHCSALAVQEGDRVTQGQYLCRIGATGRATGPHLHWGMKWRESRLDPLLLAGPMP